MRANYPQTVNLDENLAHGSGLRHSIAAMHNPYALAFSMGCFLYVAAEAAIYVWMPTLLVDYTGSAVSLATYSISIFFILRAAGRFIGARMLEHFYWTSVLALFSGLILVCFVASVAGGAGVAVYLLPASGLFMSVIYPSTPPRRRRGPGRGPPAPPRACRRRATTGNFAPASAASMIGVASPMSTTAPGAALERADHRRVAPPLVLAAGDEHHRPREAVERGGDRADVGPLRIVVEPDVVELADQRSMRCGNGRNSLAARRTASAGTPARRAAGTRPSRSRGRACRR